MKQLIVLAILATAVTVAFVLIDPLGLVNPSTPKVSYSTGLAIVLEAFSLLLPGLTLAFLLQRYGARLGQFICTASCFALPIVVLVDSVTWRWMGCSIFSASMLLVATDLRESLVDHITINTLLAMGLLLLTVAATIAALWFVSHGIAKFWESHSRAVGPSSVLCACTLFTFAASVICLTNLRSVRTAIVESPFQHPWSVVKLVRSAIEPVTQSEFLSSRSDSEFDLVSAVRIRQQQQRQASIQPSPPGQSATLPDVLVVIVESFRRELVSAEVMPNLARFADRGLLCSSHFSGGNATNHGIFSLVNGLEAIWHDSPVRYSPLMNRLLRQAGYELGFFGSHNDWRKFQMDGYISSEHFDRFDVGPPSGLERDRQSIQAASGYLQHRESAFEQRPPRLAVVYLYATHAPYRSYVDDQIFQPAADDRFLIPYTKSSREEVWNRYKNSAHSVDRLLGSLLRDDCVVVITGDHGESFLDDGTIGHGIRISEFQNMTPAVLYAPNIQPQVIDEPTMHADVLPTLLGILGLQMTDESVFDGIDLLASTDTALQDRTFVTRNYLSDEVAVISSHTNDSNNVPNEVFSSTGTVSLKQLHVQPLTVIDRNGNTLSVAANRTFDTWLMERFGQQRFAGRATDF